VIVAPASASKEGGPQSVLIVREAEALGTDQARLNAFGALKAIVSWLQVPPDDPEWRPGS
jgi:hypothetical protein